MEVLGKNTEMMSIYHGSLKKKKKDFIKIYTGTSF